MSSGSLYRYRDDTFSTNVFNRQRFVAATSKRRISVKDLMNLLGPSLFVLIYLRDSDVAVVCRVLRFKSALPLRPTQPGHPSVGKRNKNWRWLRPPLHDGYHSTDRGLLVY